MDVNAELLRHIRRLESSQFDREMRNNLDGNKRDSETSSPEVDVDIEILRETWEEKADRLLKESNKRDIALMAVSSRCTTRYAAFYAASKNRGLEVSLGRELMCLEMLQERTLKKIQVHQDTVKDDFRKTRKIFTRNEKQLIKHKSDGCLTQKRRPCCIWNPRLPPIKCQRKNYELYTGGNTDLNYS